MNPKTDPKWRSAKVEGYLRRYTAAEDKRSELTVIFGGEADRLVKDYLRLRIRLSRTDVVRSRHWEECPQLKAVEYAHGCIAPASKTSQASMIRAMAIVGRTTEEIAAEFDTEPINISVFLALFFDVQPFLPFDALLQEVVLRAQTQAPGNDVAPQEAQWLRIAYRGNWDVLQSVMFGRPLKNPARVIEKLDGQMTGQLAIRAREFTEARMISSEPGTASDFRSYLEHKRLSLKTKTNESGVLDEKKQTFARSYANVLERAAG